MMEPPSLPSSSLQPTSTSGADKFPYEQMDLTALSHYLNPSAAIGLERMVESLLATTTDRLTDKTLLLENPVRAGSLSRQAGLSNMKGQDRFTSRLKKKQESVVSVLKSSANKITYAQCLPIHELWKRQAGNQASAKQQNHLVGSMVRVDSCSVVSLVGKQGLILAETNKVIVMITQIRDQLVALPRERLSLTIVSC
jgi:hypothetical protein